MSQTRAQKIELCSMLDERLRRQRLKLADKASTDFFTFFRHFAWPVLEPATKYVDNWHIHAICEHLQAITRGDLTRLIINMPFRMLKSTLITQAWPAWEWIEKPSLQYLTASYAKDLATRDAVNSRRIIESDAYQTAFGDRFKMTSDQNVKTRYENNRRGQRTVTSTDSSATGFGGNRILVDDPISAKLADSETARLSSIEWWKGTVATRFNNPSEDSAVIVMQRFHELDLSGYLLAEHPGVFEHLVFPMRYESKRSVYIDRKITEVPTHEVTTSIGFKDPRTVEGELLCPARLNEKAVSETEKLLGQYHTSAQLQQHPASRGGVIFLRKNWNFWRALPEFEESIISVDCSFKDKNTSDYVAIQVWVKSGANKYLIKRIRERLGFGATVNMIRSVRASTKRCVAILVEDKANGSAVIETLQAELPGVIAIEPEGGKVARAFAIQPEHEAGNLWLPDPSVDPDIETYLTEVSSFPNAQNDDETDATTQAINWLRNRERNMGVLQFYRDQSTEVKTKQADMKKAEAYG